MSPLLQKMMSRLQAETEDGTETPGGAPAVEENPRMSAMDAIANRNEAEIETDLAAQGMQLRRAMEPAPPPEKTEGEQTETTAQTTTPAPPPVESDSTQATQDQLAIQLGADPVPVETLDRVRVKFTVAGQERVMTVEEMRREAQLDGAARDRLRQATELLESVKATSATPTATAPVPAAPPAGNDAAVATTHSDDVAAKARQIVNAILEGKDEDAVKELTEVLSEGRRPVQATPKAEDLIDVLVPAVKQQLSQDEASKRFAAEFKDIVADPYLVDIADRNFQQVSQEGLNMSFEQTLMEAGKRTRAWMQRYGMKPATEPAAPPIESRKLETQKSQIDNVSGLSTKATPAEESVPTVSDTIAEMRRSRLAA